MHFVVAIFLVVVSWAVSSHICGPTCLFLADISFTFLLLGTFLITKRRRQAKQHGTIQRSSQRGRESHAAHEKTRKGTRTARAAETEDCRGLLSFFLNCSVLVIIIIIINIIILAVILHSSYNPGQQPSAGSVKGSRLLCFYNVTNLLT